VVIDDPEVLLVGNSNASVVLRLSSVKGRDKRLLLRRLDRSRAVVVACPRGRLIGDNPCKHSQASDCCSRPSVTAYAADLHHVSCSGAIKQSPQRFCEICSVLRESEVGPVEQFVLPRRLPTFVEVDTEVGQPLATVGVRVVKGNGRKAGSVRQSDGVPVDGTSTR